MPETIVFIDSRVPDHETLLASFDSSTEIIFIDPELDGLNQIADALSERSDYSSIRIFSHGSPGTLLLGSTGLNAGNLETYRDELSAIGSALHRDGDLLLYGCNVGAGEDGAAFIDMLATMTGADVAASDDPTGGSAASGDWDLEVASGDVDEGNIVMNDGYAYTLDIVPVTEEFLVNTFTNGPQSRPDIAALQDGGYVIVWESEGQESSLSPDEKGIYGQRFNANGDPEGYEFWVNAAYSRDNQSAPKVEALQDGGYIVIWQSRGQDGSGAGIYGQRFDSKGVAVENEFQVNTYSEGSQWNHDLVLLKDGGFVKWTRVRGQFEAEFKLVTQPVHAAEWRCSNSTTWFKILAPPPHAAA